MGRKSPHVYGQGPDPSYTGLVSGLLVLTFRLRSGRVTAYGLLTVVEVRDTV